MEQKGKNTKVTEKLTEDQELKKDFLPEEITEIVEKLDPKEKKIIRSSFEVMMSSTNMPPYFPLLKKITGEHIDKIIEYSEKDDERGFRFAKISKLYTLIFVILGIGVFIFLTVFLAKDNSNIFMDIIKVGLGFLGGFGVGSFFKKTQG